MAEQESPKITFSAKWPHPCADREARVPGTFGYPIAQRREGGQVKLVFGLQI
jgi:hypothetical protein